MFTELRKMLLEDMFIALFDLNTNEDCFDVMESNNAVVDRVFVINDLHLYVPNSLALIALNASPGTPMRR